MKTQLTREQIAMIEAGQTDVGSRPAWFLSAFFLVLIMIVPLIQLRHELNRPGRAHSLALPRNMAAAWRRPADGDQPWYQRALALNRRMLSEMHEWETTLEDDAIIGQRIRPAMQYFMARGLGAGNEQAYCGRANWLFFRPDVDYLTGAGFLEPAVLARRAAAGHEWQIPPQPDPRPALLEFQRQLAERDIELVLVPTPAKTMIHPERFVAKYADVDVPLLNRSYQRFLAELQAAGLHVFDPATVMATEFRDAGKDAFLATDTHWRPEAMMRVTAGLADYLRANELLPEQASAAMPDRHYNYTTHELATAHQGDIAAMLRLPDWQEFYHPETVTIRQVRDTAGELWRADPDAAVLVLGDSFCNIYTLEAMGWGESAGFVEHLSLALRRPLDRILINDNAALAPRAFLTRELARGRDRLAGKHLVIYQFAVRELAVGDWRLLDMRLGTPPDAGFLQVPAGETMQVRGVVAAVTAAPRPGSVPYSDHLVSLHLVDIQGAPPGSQALVYTWSMRDNTWTAAARCRPGETVEMTLHSWNDVAGELDGINRSEFDDLELQLQEPCWSAELQPLGFLVEDTGTL